MHGEVMLGDNNGNERKRGQWGEWSRRRLAVWQASLPWLGGKESETRTRTENHGQTHEIRALAQQSKPFDDQFAADIGYSILIQRYDER
jgi:hypothetical protein